MNNDLISREALKKDLKQYFTDGVLDGVSAKLAFNQILHDIDNAPTVERPTELCKGCRFLKDRETCEEKIRPQGEWKFSQGVTTQGSLKCPFCDYRDYHKTYSNFCPNCGAKMKGGAE